jgi:hypothetical protein
LPVFSPISALEAFLDQTCNLVVSRSMVALRFTLDPGKKIFSEAEFHLNE